MKLIFNTSGNEKQKEVCRNWCDPLITDIVYGGSKGSGKTYLGCSLIFGDAFTYPCTHYFIARKSLNDIRKFTIPSIYEVFNHWGLNPNDYNFNGQDNFFELSNGSKVFLLEAKYYPSDPLYQRFGSIQMTRGWIEEAGEIEEMAFNNLAATIGRWKNSEFNLVAKLLQTCNPSKNYLYRNYYKPFIDAVLPGWKKFIQALPTDNKRLPAGYIEQLKRVLNPNQQERLLKGNWEFDDDPAALMSYEKICDLFNNTHVQGGTKYITADIARFGTDKTVIMVWDGLKVIKLRVINHSTITDAADAIKALKNEYRVQTSNIICDEDGIGGGVVDILACKGFVNNSRPKPNKDAVGEDRNKPENFDNLKSQCYFKLAEDVEDGNIDLSVLDRLDAKKFIIEELEQVKQKDVDSDLKKGVVPKDKVKELLGRSPDFADCLMMRKYFDISPQPAGVYRSRLPGGNSNGYMPDYLKGMLS